MKIRSNWAQVMASRRTAVGFVRTYRPTGWKGGRKRRQPTGEHKCLGRAEMHYLLAHLK